MAMTECWEISSPIHANTYSVTYTITHTYMTDRQTDSPKHMSTYKRRMGKHFSGNDHVLLRNELHFPLTTRRESVVPARANDGRVRFQRWMMAISPPSRHHQRRNGNSQTCNRQHGAARNVDKHKILMRKSRLGWNLAEWTRIRRGNEACWKSRTNKDQRCVSGI